VVLQSQHRGDELRMKRSDSPAQNATDQGSHHLAHLGHGVASPSRAAAKTDGAALPYTAAAMLEPSSRQAPQSVHVEGRMDQAGHPSKTMAKASFPAMADMEPRSART